MIQAFHRALLLQKDKYLLCVLLVASILLFYFRISVSLGTCIRDAIRQGSALNSQGSPLK